MEVLLPMPNSFLGLPFFGYNNETNSSSGLVYDLVLELEKVTNLRYILETNIESNKI